VANVVYQLVRKPTEIFFPVSATMNRLALANKGVEIHRWHSPAETQVRTRLPAGGGSLERTRL